MPSGVAATITVVATAWVSIPFISTYFTYRDAAFRLVTLSVLVFNIRLLFFFAVVNFV